MASYRDLDSKNSTDRRILERIERLRSQFRSGLPDPSHIPRRSLNETLLLATWNIRDLDKPTYGERSKEAIHYIAEIIEQFDLVAIQEVYRDLAGLRRVLDVLGPTWEFLASDSTEGGAGNDERLVFLYDTRKVQHGEVVAEVVLPPVRDDAGNIIQPDRQFSRTPYLVGFRAGFARFMLAAVHITWDENQAAPANRVREIQSLAAFMRARTEDPHTWSQNVILIGDFNIWQTDDDTMKALEGEGFVVPPELRNLPSNARRSRHYDQIAFKVDPDRLGTTGQAGVFDYYQSVFTEADHGTIYDPNKADGTRPADPLQYYMTYWRTHQMSDHLPMWCELQIDFSDQYIHRKLVGTA